MDSRIGVPLSAIARFSVWLPLLACGSGPVGDSSPTATTSESLSQGQGEQAPKSCPAGLTGPINLPADDAVHPYSAYSDEWWYYSSHLESDEGDAEFGFAQIVYTSLDPASGSPIQYVDATITDIAEGAYHFGGRQYAFAPAVVLPNAFDFAIGSERVEGGNGS